MWTTLLMYGILVVLGTLCPAWTQETQNNAGFKFRVTQAGLHYAAQQAIDVISADIQGQSIPDQRGSQRVSVGSVEYSITGISTTSFGKPTSTVLVTPDQMITWTARGASIGLHGDWRYKYKLGFFKVRDHGSLDVSVSGVNFQISVALGMDASTGRPTISTPSGCSCTIGDVNVRFHGGASWLYNIFDSRVEDLLEDKLEELMCDEALEAINVKAARNLARLKVLVPIEDIMELDYRLVAPPVFNQGYLDTYHKGEVFWLHQPTEAPFQPAVLPDTTSTNKMVYLWLSDYVLNTMGYVLHNHGYLQYNLTAHDLSGDDKDRLNTTCPGTICIGSVLYQVGKIYPNCRMALDMATSESPTVNITTGQIDGHFTGVIKYNVQFPNGTNTYVFTTNVTVKIGLVAAIKNGNLIVAKVTSLVPTVKLVDSTIKGLSDQSLTTVFQFAAKGFIIPKLNEVGAKGLEIPSADEVNFVNPVLSLQQDALMIGTDLQYVPSTLYFEAVDM